MKYVNLFFCALMVLFAAVQYNDPDVLMWVAIYAVPALWTGLAALRPQLFRRRAVVVLLVSSAAAALAGTVAFWPTTPGFWRQDVWWDTETAREGMGFMIAALAVMVALVTVLVRKRRSD